MNFNRFCSRRSYVLISFSCKNLYTSNCCKDAVFIPAVNRGSQKYWGCLPGVKDPQSIEGNVEIALGLIRKKYISDLTFSSRTDAGVHAFNNTAHFDLETKSGEPFMDKTLGHITHRLNKYFANNNLGIILKDFRRVPDTFHARFSALSRTYLYRFAFLKIAGKEIIHPIEEWQRLHLIRKPNFDIEKFKEALTLFEGKHDFETFRKVQPARSKKSTNIRTVYSIEVFKSNPLLTLSHHQHLDDFHFYDVKIKGRGFLHNQIRRMVGASEAVALDVLTTRDVQIMLQVPSKHSWNTRVAVAPPWGLYLYEVQYNPKDLQPTV